jgi:hypothetical protein
MATIRATIAAKLGLDTQDFIKGARDAGKSTEQLEKQVDQAATSVAELGEGLRKASRTATIAGGVIGAAMGIAVKAASDLQESQNVTNLVFEESAAEIVAFSQTARFSLGISERAAREATAQVGGLLKNMGLTMEQTTGYSKELVQIASDMGSAFNTEPADAIYAIGAALRGETEPIRRYNVMLSDQEIRQEAVNMKLAETPKEADRAARAQAALSLIFKQTSDFAGDFTNTAEGLANSSRSLSATFEDLRASIGNSALPFMEKFNSVQIKTLETIMSFNEATNGLVGVMMMFSAGASLAIAPLLKLGSALLFYNAQAIAAGRSTMSFSVALAKMKAFVLSTAGAVTIGLTAAIVGLSLIYTKHKAKQREFNENVELARQKLMQFEPEVVGVTDRLQAMADALPKAAEGIDELADITADYALAALAAEKANNEGLGDAMQRIINTGIDLEAVLASDVSGLDSFALAMLSTGTTSAETQFRLNDLSGATAEFAEKLMAMVNAEVITASEAERLIDVLFRQNEMLTEARQRGEAAAEAFFKSSEPLRLLTEQYGMTNEQAQHYIDTTLKAEVASSNYTGALMVLEEALKQAAVRQNFFNAEIAQSIPEYDKVIAKTGTYGETFRRLQREMFGTIERGNDLLEQVAKQEDGFFGLTGQGFALIDTLTRLGNQMKGLNHTSDEVAAAQARLVDMFRQVALSAGFTAAEIQRVFNQIGLEQIFELPVNFEPVVLPGGGFQMPRQTTSALEQAEEAINEEFARIVRGAASVGTLATSQRFAQQLMGTPEDIKKAFEELFKQARDAGSLEIPELRAAFERMLEQQPLLVEFAEKRISLTNQLVVAQQKLKDAEADQLKIRKAAFAFDERLVNMERTPLENILKQVTDARQKLSDAEREAASVESKRTSYAASVAKSFSLSLTTGRGGVQYQATRILEHARNFKTYLDQLITAQFPNDVIRQVVDLGAIQGGELARRLLALSPTEIEAFKNTYDQIGQVAASIGEVAASVLFEHDTTKAAAELQKQQSLVKSLFQQAVGQADNVAVAAQARVDEIKTALEANDAAMQELVRVLQQEFGDAVVAFVESLGPLPDELQAVFNTFVSDFKLAMGETLANLLALIKTTTTMPTPYGPGGPSAGGGTKPTPSIPIDALIDAGSLMTMRRSTPSPGAGFTMGGLESRARDSMRRAFEPVPAAFYGNGGIATRPHMGVVAEKGPEAIIPLSKLGNMGGNTYNIEIRGGGYGADEIGRQVVRAIQEFERRNGKSWRS